MNKKRENRNLKSCVEIRELEGKRTITGLIPFNKLSEDMGFREEIAPSAFNKTIADHFDVRALMGHDCNKLLGRVKNSSLRLWTDTEGLRIECDLPDTSYADDAYKLIRDGYNTGMSFGFDIINAKEEIRDGHYVQILTEVKLYEVSFCVTFPAYPDTTSSARNLRGIDIGALCDSISREEITDKEKTVINNAIEKLREILEPGHTRTLEPPKALEPSAVSAQLAKFLESL